MPRPGDESAPPQPAAPAAVAGWDGSADAGLAAALHAWAAGQGSEHAALTLLARSRLLIPVLPRPAKQAAPAAAASPASHAEMGMPRLAGRDGRAALPVFTCQAALTAWQPGARPLAAPAADVWRAAAAESYAAVVIDIAGPVPMPVEGARLAALIAGRPVPPPHADPDITRAVAAAVAAQAPGARFTLRPADGDADLLLELALPPGPDGPAAARHAGLVGEAVLSAVGGRLRRGVALALR